MSPLVIAFPEHGSLPGTLYPAEPAAPAELVFVFAHGAGAGQSSPFMRRYATLLAARGIDVVTFDFPYLAAGRKLPDRRACARTRLPGRHGGGGANLPGGARHGHRRQVDGRPHGDPPGRQPGAVARRRPARRRRGLRLSAATARRRAAATASRTCCAWACPRSSCRARATASAGPTTCARRCGDSPALGSCRSRPAIIR